VKGRLLDLKLDREERVGTRYGLSTVEIRLSGPRIIEGERRLRRLEKSTSPPRSVVQAFSKQEPPLERNVVSSKRGGKGRTLLVQAQHHFISGIRLAHDRHKQGKAILPKQRPLRRAYESVREVEARHPRCVSMTERLSEAPDVPAGDRREPLADAPVNVDAPLLRDLASGSGANQVVG